MDVSITVRRGHPEDVTTVGSKQLDQGNWRLLTPSLALGMYVLPTIAGTVFKDIALREKGVAEAIWMVYVTEPSNKASIWM